MGSEHASGVRAERPGLRGTRPRPAALCVHEETCTQTSCSGSFGSPRPSTAWARSASGARSRLGRGSLGGGEPAPRRDALVKIAGDTLQVDRTLIYDVRLDQGVAV